MPPGCAWDRSSAPDKVRGHGLKAGGIKLMWIKLVHTQKFTQADMNAHIRPTGNGTRPSTSPARPRPGMPATPSTVVAQQTVEGRPIVAAVPASSPPSQEVIDLISSDDEDNMPGGDDGDTGDEGDGGDVRGDTSDDMGGGDDDNNVDPQQVDGDDDDQGFDEPFNDEAVDPQALDAEVQALDALGDTQAAGDDDDEDDDDDDEPEPRDNVDESGDQGIDTEPIVKQRPRALRPCFAVLLVLALVCFLSAGALAVHPGALSALSEHTPDVVKDGVGAWRTWTIKPAAANETTNLDSKNVTMQDKQKPEQNEGVDKSLVPVGKPPDKAKSRRGARRNGGDSVWTIKPLLAAPITIAAVYYAAVARHDAAAAQRALTTVTATATEILKLAIAKLNEYAQGAQNYANANPHAAPSHEDWNLVGQDD